MPVLVMDCFGRVGRHLREKRWGCQVNGLRLQVEMLCYCLFYFVLGFPMSIFLVQMRLLCNNVCVWEMGALATSTYL